MVNQGSGKVPKEVNVLGIGQNRHVFQKRIFFKKIKKENLPYKKRVNRGDKKGDKAILLGGPERTPLTMRSLNRLIREPGKCRRR